MKFDQNHPPSGTVRDWLDHRADIGGTAIVFPEKGTTLDWSDLRSRARHIAQHLTQIGVQKCESIAILHPNGQSGVESLYGALYGGFRATMINLAAGPDAIGFALKHSGARYAFVHPTQRDIFEKSAPNEIQAIDDIRKSIVTLHDLTATDDALLMYTSGTTGTPKGVVHSHASLLAGGWTTALAHALTDTDRGFCVLPIYHINGLCVTVMGSLVSGGSLAMVAKFSVSKFWPQIDDSAATWFSVVPTIISHLLHADATPTPSVRARLRFGRSASSALAVETQNAFEDRFSVPIVETMGLTETAAQILSNPLPPEIRKIGSPGRAAGCQVEIHDASGQSVLPDTEGEIVVQGPNVMRGYLNNPDANAATFRDSWLRTGDLGRKDKDGYIFVTGRLKELIIKGGENIAPREIDEALYTHPDIVEAAAFARPCTSYGERVEAAVALKPGTKLSEADLITLVRARVGDFKCPDIIHFMEELPKGPSGKIQRLKLADLV
ncbi:MAG: AMP-binding protein [Paracoccaceae bacterium]